LSSFTPAAAEYMVRAKIDVLAKKKGNVMNITKTLTKIIQIAVLAVAIAAATGAQAKTIVVTVNPSTWAITDIYPVTGWHRGTRDQQVTHIDVYWNQYHLYFTYGRFDTVVFESDVDNSELQVLSCKNIFYIDRSAQTAYACSAGYNGTGNGTDGEILVMKSFKNGDVYIGGEFTSAGGHSDSSYFSCYRWGAGWSGVDGVYVNGRVTHMEFAGTSPNPYRLVIWGNFDEVYGPVTSGGSHTSLPVFGQAYWNDWWREFGDSFWEDE
jgi:hypothetical protein